MEELGLMTAAIKQLDELFLMVVVGEFNSGKSSIINALLGGSFLAQGILPTTNEISVIKFRCPFPPWLLAPWSPTVLASVCRLLFS